MFNLNFFCCCPQPEKNELKYMEYESTDGVSVAWPLKSYLLPLLEKNDNSEQIMQEVLELYSQLEKIVPDSSNETFKTIAAKLMEIEAMYANENTPFLPSMI
ncbi:MAG: hypothetical protein Tsb005_09810 [Gammaproteobacteria bacterium]